MNAAIILPGQLNVPLQVTGLIEDFVRDFGLMSSKQAARRMFYWMRRAELTI